MVVGCIIVRKYIYNFSPIKKKKNVERGISKKSRDHPLPQYNDVWEKEKEK
jgi:hypothetical protein